VSAHVRRTLFDYLKGGMPPEEAASTEEHLSGCASCSEDLRTLRQALDMLPGRDTPPSEERDEQFWTSFPARVQERIDAEGKTGPPLLADAADRIISFIHVNGVQLLAGSGALAAIALAVLLLRSAPGPEPVPGKAESNAGGAAIVEPAGIKLHEYLKKSRVLLVGVSNLNTTGEDPIDLTIERRQSRALVHEARDLRREPMDARSAKLVGDLETILIELANSDGKRDAPDVEIIRSGIRHNNLLFKIRMTESALASANYERKTQ